MALFDISGNLFMILCWKFARWGPQHPVMSETVFYFYSSKGTSGILLHKISQLWWNSKFSNYNLYFEFFQSILLIKTGEGGFLKPSLYQPDKNFKRYWARTWSKKKPSFLTEWSSLLLMKNTEIKKNRCSENYIYMTFHELQLIVH